MKVRLTLSDRSWSHKLQAKRDDRGRYFVQLITQGGEPLKHGKVIGAFESLDAVVAHGPRLYAELSAANTHSGRNAAPDNSSNTTTKPNATEAKETTNAAHAAATAGA